MTILRAASAVCSYRRARARYSLLLMYVDGCILYDETPMELTLEDVLILIGEFQKKQMQESPQDQLITQFQKIRQKFKGD